MGFNYKTWGNSWTRAGRDTWGGSWGQAPTPTPGPSPSGFGFVPEGIRQRHNICQLRIEDDELFTFHRKIPGPYA